MSAAVSPLRRAGFALGFVGLVTALVVIKLLPLSTAPTRWPAPDLLLALVVAWMLRRPDLLPLAVLAPVLFVADMLLMRPPGLWTAMVITVAEGLRQRAGGLRQITPPGEVALFAGLTTGLILAHWLALTLFLVDQPPLLQQLRVVPVTLAVYPLAILVCTAGLGVRRGGRPDRPGMGRLP